MPDEEVNYRLNFVKGKDALPEAQAELQAVADQTGNKQTDAAKKAEGAYSKWLKGASEDAHLLHQPLRILHQIMGTISAVVLAVTIAWEYYRKKTDEVIKATTEQRSKNMDLIHSLEESKRAGAELTDSQEKLLKVTKEAAYYQGIVLVNSLKEKDAELKKSIASEEKHIVALNKVVDNYKNAPVSLVYYGTEIDKSRAKVAEFNKSLAENQAIIDGVKKGYKDASDALEKMTKGAVARREALDIEKQEAIAHSQAMLEIQKQGSAEILAEVLTSGDKKKAELQKLAEDEKAQIRVEETAKLAIINAAATKEFGNSKIIAAQKEALAQETADKQLAVEKKLAAEQQKIDNENLKKIKATLAAEMTAFSQAFAQRLGETHNFGAALQAAGAALIETITNQASAEIVVMGVEATLASFRHGSLTGGFFGGLAEASATAAWYTAAASAIGGAGVVISGAIGGGGGGAPSDSGGNLGGGSSPGTPTTYNGGATGPLGLPVSGSGGGPGTGQLNVQVLLDGEVLLKFISQASFNGRVAISANAIVDR
jgi:hypothetical protein